MKYGANNVQPESVHKQKEKWRAYLKRRAAAAVRVKKVATTWAWQAGALDGGKVQAHTRSEAKAIVKELLGITKGRLPKEVTVVAQAK